jgi:hypothetical protein
MASLAPGAVDRVPLTGLAVASVIDLDDQRVYPDGLVAFRGERHQMQAFVRETEGNF